MNADTYTDVELLRHGACEGGDIYRGSTDVPLSQDGWAQMRQAIVNHSQWDCVISSPLQRCSAFARHCSESLSVELYVEDGLREMHFGDWEGRQLKEVWEEDPALVSRFYQSPETTTPPGGEPVVAAQARVVNAWAAVLKKHAGRRLLIVCHGGVIRLLLSHLLDMPLHAFARLHVPYGSLTSVRIHHGEAGDFPVLMALNSAAQQA